MRSTDQQSGRGGWIWTGIRAEVGKLVKAAGYKPRPDELGAWWDVKSEAEKEAEAKKARKYR
jgi:hypothetical protein